MTEDDFIHDEDLQGGEWILEYFGYDPSYVPLLYFHWSDYEEWGCLFILQKDGQLYEWTHGYSVMSDGPQNDPFDPFPISHDRASELIDEWIATLKDTA